MKKISSDANKIAEKISVFLGESTEKEYKVQFRFDNVKYFTVNLATQEEVDNAQEFELKIEDDIGVPLLFSGLLLLILL